MEVINVLHMNGGSADTSYANNSLVQQKVISMTKPITEEAITSLYCTQFPENLRIADLGCSSGPNTFLIITDLIRSIDAICKTLGRDKSPEIQVYLNDLPGNDFNYIFRSLPQLQQKLKKELGPGFGHCFFTGVPGSFYDRLFATNSIHFIHSSYSLQWLSKVPELVEANKGNIYMASTSPQSVLKAYYKQFQRDFSQFLEYRAEEMVAGGRMVLTFLGRKSEDPSSRDGCYIWELMAKALNEMVLEGLIEEEKVDAFDIPQFTPSASEVKLEVEKEGSFSINQLQVTQVNWDEYMDNKFNPSNRMKDGGYNVAKCMRAVAEPMLVSHFGEGIIDEVFRRYTDIVTDSMAKEETKFFNVIVAMSRKGPNN